MAVAEGEGNLSDQEILDLGEAFVNAVQQRWVLGATGVKAPTPPRPKHEVFAKLLYAALLIKEANAEWQVAPQ